jgi:hypothetical protein
MLLSRDHSDLHDEYEDAKKGIKAAFIVVPIIGVILFLCSLMCCIFLYRRRRLMMEKTKTKIYPQPTYQRVYYSNNGYGYANTTNESFNSSEPRPPPQAYTGPQVLPPSYQESTMGMQRPMNDAKPQQNSSFMA